MSEISHQHSCKWCGDTIQTECFCETPGFGPWEVTGSKIIIHDSECLVCFQEEQELAVSCGG